MGADLPVWTADRFTERLQEVSPMDLPVRTVEALFRHYEELRDWNRRVSLVGPGTAGEVLERHYGESLAALPLLGAGKGRLVDLGSGAGFPGLVLAAARTDLEVWLVEPRPKKWAFLRRVSDLASLSCRCLDARVGAALPAGFPENIDVLTVRALRLGSKAWAALASRLSATGRLLLWGGAEPPDELAGWVARERVRLPGENRWILELEAPPCPR